MKFLEQIYTEDEEKKLEEFSHLEDHMSHHCSWKELLETQERVNTRSKESGISSATLS